VDPKAKNPGTAPVRLADLNRLNTTFQSITGYYMQDDSELSGELPERMKRAFVAPRFLETLGTAPAIGRDFRPEEHSPAQPTVLISDQLWRRRFNADPNVVGKKLRFAGFSWEIIGRNAGVVHDPAGDRSLLAVAGEYAIRAAADPDVVSLRGPAQAGSVDRSGAGESSGGAGGVGARVSKARR